MTPGDHVRNLLGTYCARIDAGDFDGVGALFERGALFAGDDATPLASGAEAVAAFYAQTTRRHDDGTPRTKHVVTNTVLDLADAAGTATARSDYVVFMATDGFALQPIIAGHYLDTFGRFAADWHFTERRFFVDLTGDLSHHLAITL